MFYDLNQLGRMRAREIERELEQAHRENGLRRKRRGRVSRVAGRVLVRMGAGMLAVGSQLECYEIQIVAEVRPA